MSGRTAKLGPQKLTLLTGTGAIGSKLFTFSDAYPLDVSGARGRLHRMRRCLGLSHASDREVGDLCSSHVWLGTCTSDPPMVPACARRLPVYSTLSAPGALRPQIDGIYRRARPGGVVTPQKYFSPPKRPGDLFGPSVQRCSGQTSPACFPVCYRSPGLVGFASGTAQPSALRCSIYVFDVRTNVPGSCISSHPIVVH